MQDHGQQQEDPEQEKGAEADREVQSDAGQAIDGRDCRR